MNKKWLKIIFALLIISDLTYSFYQHYHQPLLGDIAEVVIPPKDRGYYQVLHDPFGLNSLINGKKYANPNRFFAHFFTSKYFLNVPLFLQLFVSPIESVYLSKALLQFFVQVLILYLLSIYICGNINIFSKHFLLTALIISPLFQTNGYNRLMGIIDPSVVYTIFYALSLGLLMIFYWPFFKELHLKKSINWTISKKMLLLLLIPVLTFNGPLVTGVCLIISPIVLIILWWKNFTNGSEESLMKRIINSIQAIPKFYIISFLTICIFSLYSLFISRNNALNPKDSITLIERYLKLPMGIVNLIIQKPGYPLLLTFLLANSLILKRLFKTNHEAKNLLKLFGWIGIFAFIYTILLPLGGYREYRQNIIRYDTYMPVTLTLFYIFGATTLFILINLKSKSKYIYILFLALFSIAYTNADDIKSEYYYCERIAIENISSSSSDTVKLNNNYPIMNWGIHNNPKKSELNGRLFYHWNITHKPKIYYHQKQ